MLYNQIAVYMATVSLSVLVLAACPSGWRVNSALDIDNVVTSMRLWYPPNRGQSGPKLVVGGRFNHVGNIPARFIAALDLSTNTWETLGGGITGAGSFEPVTAMAVLPNGDLVIGGCFRRAGDSQVNGIARWDGHQWHAFGEEVAAEVFIVYSLLVMSNGDIVAGGWIRNLGGINNGGIARWNGQAWSLVGGGMQLPNGEPKVYSLAETPSGVLLAGGNFRIAGNVDAKQIAQWDGASWQPLGAGVTGTSNVGVQAILADREGEILIGGSFSSSGSDVVRNIARWAGKKWVSLGGGLGGSVSALSRDLKGDVVAVGGFVMATQTVVNGVARFDGAKWNPYGSGIFGLARTVVVLPNNDLIVGGSFFSNAPFPVSCIAHWTDANAPWIASSSPSQPSIAGEAVDLFAAPAAGLSEVSFRWQRGNGFQNFVDVLDGVGGSSSGGGTVSGASGQLPSPTDGTPATLTITNIQPSDAGNYRVTFWNSCGEATSIPVEVKVKAHITDINADGQVDDADFILFSAQYDLVLCADPLMPDTCSADFNQDGQVDDADFVIFVPAYHTMLFR